MMDQRYVVGARCAWFGPIQDVKPGSRELGALSVPSCPGCGSPLYEFRSREEFWNGVLAFETNGHTGYYAMLQWMDREMRTGRHWASASAATAAYKTETGRTVERL